MTDLVVIEPVDRRRLRSEKSWQSMITAAIELIKQGTLELTAQEVAERAGVGIRIRGYGSA